MYYVSRPWLEQRAKAGAKWTEEEDSFKCWANDEFWVRCEKDDTAFTPWFNGTNGPFNTWEAWISVWVSQHLEKHKMFLDIGANVGYYTMLATANYTPTIAFEPNQKAMKLLAEGLKDNGKQARLETCALSNYNGTGKLAVPDGHSGGGSLMAELSSEGIDVEVARLDSKIKHTDYLAKVDAEGAEPLIWEGMSGVWGGGSEAIFEWVPNRFNDLNGLVDSICDNWVGIINYDGSESRLTKKQLLALPADKFETVIVRHD